LNTSVASLTVSFHFSITSLALFTVSSAQESDFLTLSILSLVVSIQSVILLFALFTVGSIFSSYNSFVFQEYSVVFQVIYQ
jgi:hypothetical protein